MVNLSSSLCKRLPRPAHHWDTAGCGHHLLLLGENLGGPGGWWGFHDGKWLLQPLTMGIQCDFMLKNDEKWWLTVIDHIWPMYETALGLSENRSYDVKHQNRDFSRENDDKPSEIGGTLLPDNSYKGMTQNYQPSKTGWSRSKHCILCGSMP